MSRYYNEESPLLEREDEVENSYSQHIDFDEYDESNPRAWPRSKKLLNVATIACMSILSPLASSIYTPGIDQIAEDLNTTKQKVIATTTGFVLMLGIGPLLLAPMSEAFGRRIVYIVCFSIFTLLQITAALAPNIAMLITVRTISGFFGSVGIANGGGTINDMFPSSGRARVYGWYLLGPLLGPVLGPLLGGVIVQRLGWRWIYWVLTVICSCNTLAGVLLLEESYAPVLLARKKKKLEQQSENHTTFSYEGQDERPLRQKLSMSLRRPLVIFYQPTVLILGAYQALIFGTTYTVYTQLQEIFANENAYNFDTEQVGLLALATGLGSVTSVLFFVPQIDTVYNRLAARNKGIALPEYRLPLTNIGAVLVPASLFWFGWTVYYQLYWVVPISALYFYGIGQVMVLNTIQNYFIDSFSKYAASAIAAGSVLRSIFGGLSPLFASKMFASLGYGWGTSVFAFIAVVIAPSPLVLFYYGPRLRERYPVNF
jgi:multidrug resistance protein